MKISLSQLATAMLANDIFKCACIGAMGLPAYNDPGRDVTQDDVDQIAVEILKIEQEKRADIRKNESLFGVVRTDDEQFAALIGLSDDASRAQDVLRTVQQVANLFTPQAWID